MRIIGMSRQKAEHRPGGQSAITVLFRAAVLFVLLWLVAPPSIAGDTTAVRELHAYRINSPPPIIDGELSDAIWNSPDLSRVGDFLQQEPDEGKPATESTFVAVAYDDHALYVAFWCYDSEPDKIISQLVRRDRWVPADWVSINLDPYHDHQSGYSFMLGVANVQLDSRYSNDSNEDFSWDGVWSSGTRRQSWGWSAEMRIPYHCLRFAEQDVHTWGLDFSREIKRKNEMLKWPFSPSSQGGIVSKFGHLTGLTGIKPAGHLEILPYLVSKAETEPKHLGNPDGRDFIEDAGVDLKYGISSNLTLNATVNPDFGQVELDEPVLNLSAYETYFEEKRPFFVEGSELFSTEFNLFYSRRIGRPPLSGVSDPDPIIFEKEPMETSILGAAKITGRIGEKTSVAFLNAVTRREFADYAALANISYDSTGEIILSADTVFRRGLVSPEANHAVLRVKQDILKNSNVGLMMTSFSQDRSYPAVTGGIDWTLRTHDNGWAMAGQAVFSRVDDRRTGYGYDLEFEKVGGKHVRGAVGLEVRDRDLQLNHLGFLPRAGDRSSFVWLHYRTTDDWWIIRNTWQNLEFDMVWNFDGVIITRGGNYNFQMEFLNGWKFNSFVEVQGEKYSDIETRGNGLWEWPEYPSMAVHFNLDTDERAWWNVGLGLEGGSDRGGPWRGAELGIDLRPRGNIELSAGLFYGRFLDSRQWLSNDFSAHPLFADLDRDDLFLSGSASVMLNRNLSVQLSAEGLIAGLDYKKFAFYHGEQRYDSAGIDQAAYGELFNRNYSELNSTFLVRWEYHPGSTLYLVWTRSRPETDYAVSNIHFHRDLKRFFSAGSRNLFLIKASYWLNI